jgi:hypothetical protein
VRLAPSGAAKGPGRLSALLTRNMLALEKVIQVNLSVRHQLRGHRLHRPGTGGWPGCPRPRLPVPADVKTAACDPDMRILFPEASDPQVPVPYGRPRTDRRSVRLAGP